MLAQSIGLIDPSIWSSGGKGWNFPIPNVELSSNPAIPPSNQNPGYR